MTMRGGGDPLVERLGSYAVLSPRERDVLASMQGRPIRVRKGERLCTEGASSTQLFAVREGALIASQVLVSGARQILRIHHVGDLANTSCLGWARTAASLTAATPAVVCPIERDAFGRMFAAEPHLAALCHGVSVAENVALCDRLASLGRMEAPARLALLLLELNARQAVGSGRVGDTVDLFLSQTEIGDAVGLTKVHVNRVLKALGEEGLIARTGREVRVLDRDRLVEMSGFVDRLGWISADWLPDETATPKPTAATYVTLVR